MRVKAVPTGYHTVTPYLVVEGAAKLIDFAKKVFDAKEKERMTRPDGGIMHAEVKIGDSMVMLADAMGEYKAAPVTLYLYVKNADAAYKRALAAGAISEMEPADMFWGDRNAGGKDVFGNRWWMATRKEKVSPKELKKRAAEYVKKQRKA